MEVIHHPYLEPIYPNLHRVNNIDLEAVTFLNEIPNMANRNYKILPRLHTTREVTADELIYGYISTYVNNGQHLDGGIVSVKNILEIRRRADVGYENNPTWRNGNRKLLWHACTSWRIASILQHGFQTPTFYDGYGQGFGRGFYFSDRIIKCRRMSSSHNGQSHKNDVGYLLLCDVLLGNQCTARRLPRQYRRPPPGRNSIVALGYNAPNPDEDVRYNGSTIPLGITERRTFRNGGYDIQYNKYVSYSSEYVKPRYIIKVQYASN